MAAAAETIYQALGAPSARPASDLVDEQTQSAGGWGDETEAGRKEGEGGATLTSEWARGMDLAPRVSMPKLEVQVPTLPALSAEELGRAVGKTQLAAKQFRGDFEAGKSRAAMEAEEEDSRRDEAREAAYSEAVRTRRYCPPRHQHSI